MNEALEIDLGELGGTYRFTSPDQIYGWIELERERWSWLSEIQGRDSFNLVNHIGHRLNHLRDQVAGAVSQGHPFGNLSHLFNEIYVTDQGQRILHSEGDLGRRVMDIRAAQGPLAGSAAYALAVRRGNLGQISDPEQVAGALLLAAPSLVSSDTLARQLAQERRNLRDRADRLFEKLEQEATQRWAQHAEDRLRGRAVAKRWTKRRFGKWQALVDGIARDAAEANSEFASARETTATEFNNLRAAFLEAMRLQAPAKLLE